VWQASAACLSPVSVGQVQAYLLQRGSAMAPSGEASCPGGGGEHAGVAEALNGKREKVQEGGW